MRTEAQREAYRRGWELSRRLVVERHERALTPAERVLYERWERACERINFRVGTQERLEWLSDLRASV